MVRKDELEKWFEHRLSMADDPEIKLWNDEFTKMIQNEKVVEVSASATAFIRRRLHEPPDPFSLSELLKGYEQIKERSDLPPSEAEGEAAQGTQES